MANRRLAPVSEQPESFAFTPENAEWAKGQIAKYPEGRQASAVIPLLWKAQEQNGGWLPQKAIEAVADQLGMPHIRVLEVATFYTMFALEPVGRYWIQVCGTAPCDVCGARELKQYLHERLGPSGHVSPDGNFSWLEVECLGACCNAPMAQINHDYFEDLTPESLGKLMDDLAAGRPVKVGSQIGRTSSEPKDAVSTLQDETLFDGSRVGAWRKRFEEEGLKETGADATGEKARTDASAAENPKAARPDAGRATETKAAAAPAQAQAPAGVEPKSDKGEVTPDRTTVAVPRTGPETVGAPQSGRSYTMTPVKPEDGRPVAAPKGTTPEAGAEPATAAGKTDGSQAKPVGLTNADKAADKGPPGPKAKP